MDVARMIRTMWGEEDGIGEGREGNQMHQPGGQKDKRVGVINVSGLYREDPLGGLAGQLLAGEFRVGGYAAIHILQRLRD